MQHLDLYLAGQLSGQLHSSLFNANGRVYSLFRMVGADEYSLAGPPLLLPQGSFDRRAKHGMHQ